MKLVFDRSPLRRVFAAITIVVGWYAVMQVSPWSRSMARFAAGIWSTDTASVSAGELVAVAVAGALCVIVARLVGYLSGWQAGLLILLFWSAPVFLSYGLGAVLSGFGPGAGATSEASRTAAIGVILGSPLFAGVLIARLNKFVELAIRGPGLQNINSNEHPVAWFFYGPLLHTPQGIACLFFGLCAIAAGIIFVAAPSNAPVLGFRMVLLVWPLVVFTAFAALGYRNGFRPSSVHAVLVAIVGVVPFVLPYCYATTT